MITYLLLLHTLHDFVVPSLNVTLLVPLSWQSLSCCTVCGVSACVQLAAWQPGASVVTTGLVAVVLLTSTPLLKTSARTDVFNNGVLVSSTTATSPVVTTVAPGCQAANWTQADTPQTVQEDKLCKDTGTSSVTFSDGTTKSCSACSNNRYVIIRQTKTQTNSVITADGVPTQNSTTPTGAP